VTRYGDWLAAQPSPSSLNVLNVKPWRGSALVAIDARLLYVLVDSFFGGSGVCPDLSARSALTPTEERLNGMLVELLTTHFTGAFAPVASIRFEKVATEINAHYATIATPSETVVVSRLVVQHKEQGGELSLVLPMSMLEPVRERLDESLKASSKESQTRWFQSLRAQLEDTELDLCTVFVETQLSMRELLKLKPGDILPMEMPKTATLYVGGRALFRGKFGRSRGYNALKVIEPITRPGNDEQTKDA
jgi:flagellar motor switch protein FliM